MLLRDLDTVQAAGWLRLQSRDSARGKDVRKAPRRRKIPRERIASVENRGIGIENRRECRSTGIVVAPAMDRGLRWTRVARRGRPDGPTPSVGLTQILSLTPIP